jgi:hypothetical protein
MSKPFTVSNEHVDGKTVRRYSTLEGAAKRFEEMSGHPLPAHVNHAETVSDYGTVVWFESSIDLTVNDPAYGMTDDDIFSKYAQLKAEFNDASDACEHGEDTPEQRAEMEAAYARLCVYVPAWIAAKERYDLRQQAYQDSDFDDMRYGGEMHRLYGDAWLYQDCPGAW